MKSFREMRREGALLLRGGWFFRILMVFVILQSIGSIVVGFLAGVHKDMGIVRFGDFWKSKIGAYQAGLDYTLPTSADYWRMSGAGILENFLAYIFGAILLYGVSVVLLKALRRDENRWFAESMGGFVRPWGVAWLLCLQNLKVLLGFLLFIVPGFVATYRYRQAWYVKCEHPDWTASACLKESARLMDGYKGKAFLFDLSYLGWMVVLIFGGVAVVVAQGLELPVLSLIVGLAFTMFCLYFIANYCAGRVVFYREVKAQNPPCPAES